MSCLRCTHSAAERGVPGGAHASEGSRCKGSGHCTAHHTLIHFKSLAHSARYPALSQRSPSPACISSLGKPPRFTRPLLSHSIRPRGRRFQRPGGRATRGRPIELLGADLQVSKRWIAGQADSKPVTRQLVGQASKRNLQTSVAVASQSWNGGGTELCCASKP